MKFFRKGHFIIEPEVDQIINYFNHKSVKSTCTERVVPCSLMWGTFEPIGKALVVLHRQHHSERVPRIENACESWNGDIRAPKA